MWTGHRELFEALELDAGKTEVISVVGGGGKTTFLRRLQREYKKRDICHVVSTTTHMNYERDDSFLEEESLDSFFCVLKKCGTVTAGIPVTEDKMKSPSEKFLTDLNCRQTTLLLEADGSRNHPVKIPAEHEPVVRPDTTVLAAVYGLDCVGGEIGQVAFRPGDVAEFLGKTESDMLSLKDLARIACSDLGGKKCMPAGCRYVVIFNKCDVCEDLEQVKDVAEYVLKAGADSVLVTSELWSE